MSKTKSIERSSGSVGIHSDGSDVGFWEDFFPDEVKTLPGTRKKRVPQKNYPRPDFSTKES